MKKEGEGSFASMNSIRFSTPTTYRAPGELISGAEAIEIIEIEQVVCSFQFAPSFLPFQSCLRHISNNGTPPDGGAAY